MKEYYSNGSIKFQGDYVDGKKWNAEIEFRNELYTLKNGKGTFVEFELIYPSTRIIYNICEYENGLKNGKVKRYCNNFLCFEGEYKNGLINGKGKEYSKYRLKFEGEYLNGERNGKGKKFNNDGKLIFDGEYLYGYQRKGK